MSKNYSDLAAVQTGVGAKVLPIDLGGRVRLCHFTYTPVAGGTAGDTLVLARLPKGARLLPISVLYFAAGQNANFSVKVGDAADDDRYLTLTTIGASATSKNLTALSTSSYKTAEECEIILTGATAGWTANKTIAGDLYFVVD